MKGSLLDSQDNPTWVMERVRTMEEKGSNVNLVSAPDPLQRVHAERRLSVDLHPRLEARVRAQFLLGEVELAAFAAMREVEIRVREATDAPSPPQEEPPTEE